MSRDPRDPIVAPQHYWIEAGPGRWVSTRGLPLSQVQRIEAALQALARVRSTTELHAIVTHEKKSA